VKALSVMQPWASLIACGAKRYETRSWATSYRGPLAIHASAGFPRGARARLDDAAFALALARGGYPSAGALPLGRVVAVAVLADCVPTVPLVDGLDSEERAFGDYAPGRWAWRLEGVRALPAPVPARGRLGLWEWRPDFRFPPDAPRP
jgi:hypothetical protein